MFISTCLACSDIQVEISQFQETFSLVIQSADNSHIHLTVNYTQAKLLAEGLTGFLHQAPVQPLLAIKSGAQLGDVKVQIDLSAIAQTDQERAEPECLPINSTVPTARPSLSEIA